MGYLSFDDFRCICSQIHVLNVRFSNESWPIHWGLPYHLFVFLGFSAEELHQKPSADWRQQMPQGLEQRAERERRMSMWSATEVGTLDKLLDDFCCLVACRILRSSCFMALCELIFFFQGMMIPCKDPPVLVWRCNHFPWVICIHVVGLFRRGFAR